MTEPTTCRSCRAPVVFVPSATSGKTMILDAKPEKRVIVVAGPTYSAMAQPGERRAFARVVDVYTDHHATCPDAAAWKGQHR